MFQNLLQHLRHQLNLNSRAFVLLFGAVLLLLSFEACHADTVWSGVVYAQNVSDPQAAPPELRSFEAKLKRAFGYNQFEILGKETADVDEKGDHWLIPGQDFSVRAAVEKRMEKGYCLQIQLFQGKRLLVNTRAELGLSSPLVIRGPLYGDGQLLIVLEVR